MQATASTGISMVSPEAVAMISSANTAAIMTTAIQAAQEKQQQQNLSSAVAMAPAVPVVPDARDRMLVSLEVYLKRNMKEADIQCCEDGKLLFNVNQVAYLVDDGNDKEDTKTGETKEDGKITKSEQKTIKRRIKEGLKKIHFVRRQCKRTGNGKCML